jgi:hypothetical protein
VKGEGKLEVDGIDGGAGGWNCLGSATFRTSEIEGKDWREGESLESAPGGFPASEDIMLDTVAVGVG